jgi:hypothetical protein
LISRLCRFVDDKDSPTLLCCKPCDACALPFGRHYNRFDSCCHAAGDYIAEIQRLKMTRLPQSAYRPDLSPCDFWFFGFAKQAIQDEVFDNADQLMQRLHSIFDQVTFENLRRVFLNWMERLSWVVEHNGAYFQE